MDGDGDIGREPLLHAMHLDAGRQSGIAAVCGEAVEVTERRGGCGRSGIAVGAQRANHRPHRRERVVAGGLDLGQGGHRRFRLAARDELGSLSLDDDPRHVMGHHVVELAGKGESLVLTGELRFALAAAVE
jgi:hypothetical protein